MSAFAIAFTFSLLAILISRRDFREFLKYCSAGLLVSGVDFIVEYLGTSAGRWTYNESIYFIFNLIPVELVLLFFSAGVIARFIFIKSNEINIPIKSKQILYLLILIFFLNWIRGFYQGIKIRILPLAVLIGLWGISNISNKNKNASLVIALSAGVVDLIIEIIMIGNGVYSYKSGFSLTVPLTYGLLTLGVLAVMGKLHKLDDFLDHPLTRKFLKTFSIYRKKYSQKADNVKDKVKEKVFK